MDRKEAYSYLDITEDADQDTVQDVLDEKVFTLRDYLLRNAPVRQLVLSRKARFEHLSLAAEALGLEASTLPHETSEDQQEPESLIEVLRQYESSLASVRQQIASTFSPWKLAACCDRMVKVQEQYEGRYLRAVTEFEEQEGSDVPELKTGEQPDSGKLIKTLIAFASGEAEKAELASIFAERNRIRRVLKIKTIAGS